MIKTATASEAAILVRNREQIRGLEEEKTLNSKALAVLDQAIQIISANGIGRIESIISDGLKLVFGEDLKLVIERKEGARGDSYRILVKQGDVVGPPIDTMGGGVVNVISFLLRVIMIQRFRLSKFIVLDESFNNVSADFLPKVSKMLRSLCDDHGYTILSITQAPLLACSANRVIRVEKGPLLRELSPEELEELRSHDKDQGKDRQGDLGEAEGSDSSASKKIHKDPPKTKRVKLQAQDLG